MKFKIVCLIYVFSFSIQARYPDAPSFTSAKITTEELLMADVSVEKLVSNSNSIAGTTNSDIEFDDLINGNEGNSAHAAGTSENSDGGAGVHNPWAGQ